jgi:hypothetical protein
MEGVDHQGEELTDIDDGNVVDDEDDDERDDEREELGGNEGEEVADNVEDEVDEEDEEEVDEEDEEDEVDEEDRDDKGENEIGGCNDECSGAIDNESGDNDKLGDYDTNPHDDDRHNYLSSILSAIEEEDHRARQVYLLDNPDEDQNFVIHSEEDEYRLQVLEDDHDYLRSLETAIEMEEDEKWFLDNWLCRGCTPPDYEGYE